VHLIDYRSARALVELQVKEGERRARYAQMIEEAGLAQPGWPSRQVRRLAGQLGHLMIKLGRRLQQVDLPEPLPLRGQVRGGG
jgi:hypothetical protein